MKLLTICVLLGLSSLVFSCNDGHSLPGNAVKYDEDVLKSVLAETDSLKTFPFVNERVEAFKKAMQQPVPVLLCGDSLNQYQLLAQTIALKDSGFIKNTRQPGTNIPYRNEVFGVYPARESDMAYVKAAYNLQDCYRVEMYNYALNLSSIAITDIKQQKVLFNSTQEQTQPDLSPYLRDIAVKIAISSSEVETALGIKPEEKDALMASTKTALNRSRCERSRHLCVAPTFVKEGKALWAIVDLTNHKLVGVRWTNVGTTGPAPTITERRLQDDKVTACFCEKETTLEKDGWKLNYMLTSSDGLRVAQVSFNGKPVLQSAKLVDWHVSYSGTDGFGYSDAVGCPYFSQAAVVAVEIPKVAVLKNTKNEIEGFVLEQTFKSEGWPGPCNYDYKQRFEFYKDGRFRVSAASLGRGCGNDGTYRPVFRIAFAAPQNNFSEWNGKDWTNWPAEKWMQQSATTTYTKEGYLFKLLDNTGSGYYVEPGRGQFNDKGRGDNAYIYVTANKPTVDEGESDLVTIGPCCNTDYQQGPEKFIGTVPDNIQHSKLVMWYVAQLKNDDSKGREYCWAESVLENGIYVTHVYPCFCGPMFIPVK
ncbi:hypothetical protein ACQ33O_13560 [Ferruginibacter sp. SUN002]|uniref:hypothetical protein n=1 Tax=Ferruginibacter sp. SUN002 TaxID=2937789 RepID=UPI003D35A984